MFIILKILPNSPSRNPSHKLPARYGIPLTEEIVQYSHTQFYRHCSRAPPEHSKVPGYFVWTP